MNNRKAQTCFSLSLHRCWHQKYFLNRSEYLFQSMLPKDLTTVLCFHEVVRGDSKQPPSHLQLTLGFCCKAMYVGIFLEMGLKHVMSVNSLLKSPPHLNLFRTHLGGFFPLPKKKKGINLALSIQNKVRIVIVYQMSLQFESRRKVIKGIRTPFLLV